MSRAISVLNQLIENLETKTDEDGNKVSSAGEQSTKTKHAYPRVFRRQNTSPHVLNARYAVRGSIVVRAGEIQNELKDEDHTYPFDKVIMCNIGNPQALGAIPLTFHRQVLSACLYPPLLCDINKSPFPKDVINRANKILGDTSSYTIGAYTHSQGYSTVRESVSKFICKRDNDGIYSVDSEYTPDISNIYLTDGASSGIKTILQCLISNPKDGVLLPMPQYPLYSATVSLLNGSIIPYYLNESNNWSFEINNALNSIKESKQRGVVPKVLVVINPNNPTGQCLSIEDMKTVIELAYNENMVVLADEVYQENIYDPVNNPFTSFKKVLLSCMDDDKYKENVELISFHSVSKGILGECGLRGGYMELCNISKEAKDEIYKLVSINLCPNTVGQITVELMVNPPQLGDDSYDLYKTEYDKQYESLKRRADILSNKLNEIDGIKCQSITGAMYAFPSIILPKKAVEHASKKLNIEADKYYCMELLENSGICVVPGSGFGQVNGTFHFRTTLLPPENEIEQVVEKIGEFHRAFVKRFE